MAKSRCHCLGLVAAVVLTGAQRGGVGLRTKGRAYVNCRLEELVEIADHVANISAKHEGGDPAVDQTRARPSDILDYFRDKDEIEAAGEMAHMLRNYLDKHDAVNRAARALTENGLTFIAARNLHYR